MNSVLWHKKWTTVPYKDKGQSSLQRNRDLKMMNIWDDEEYSGSVIE